MTFFRTLKVDLLDLWLVGSGRGEGARIDATPLLDADGLPYLPGKTLKGLIRDAALELSSLSPTELKDDDFLAIFGSDSRSVGRYDTTPGRLHVTDARLPGAVRQALANDGIDKRALFHDIQSTAIDDELGVAKRRTLRLIRTAVPMTLAATLESSCEGDLAKIAVALPLVQALGSHRTRGLGRCVLTATNP